ncbi:DUF3604 domain-containing protein, partial [Candidatus Bipolaricaulota bacterium]|nr:DUF3604 domain-containing protein [Candidatus Bipolaricaulota bacterium]
MGKREVFWGDFHKHLQDIEKADSIIKSAKKNLDFYPLLCYPFVWFLQDSDGEKEYLGQPSELSDSFGRDEGASKLLVESTGHRREYDRWWKAIQDAASRYHEPGEFVTLTGYEWHGDRRRYGDNNVIYFEGGGNLDPEPELPDLYENLSGEKALVIPHHIGYQKKRRGKDWDSFNEDLSPVAEIYSYHGSSEREPSRLKLNNNPSMGPGHTGSLWQEGLDRGYRVGAIASNDGPGLPGGYGNGLAAVLADSLTRDGLYEAIKNRRTYAVTGDRIKLSYHVNAEPMGSVVKNFDEARVDFEVNCPDALDRVELILNGKRVRAYDHMPDREFGKDSRYNLKIDFGWGPADHYGLSVDELDWEGAIKVENGEFTGADGCFTRLGQELHWSAKEVGWNLATRRSGNELNSELKQSVIVKLIGGPDTKLRFRGNGYDFSKTISELGESSEVIALEEYAKRKIEEETGVKREEVLNKDVFYFNSPKIKLHKATTE